MRSDFTTVYVLVHGFTLFTAYLSKDSAGLRAPNAFQGGSMQWFTKFVTFFSLFHNTVNTSPPLERSPAIITKPCAKGVGVILKDPGRQEVYKIPGLNRRWVFALTYDLTVN